MTYDHWKTTNPMDEELGSVEGRTPVRPPVVESERWHRKVWLYRDYIIYHEMTPVPTRAWDWHYLHEDYDGAPDGNDNRHGDCASLQACLDEIDDWIEDHEE